MNASSFFSRGFGGLSQSTDSETTSGVNQQDIDTLNRACLRWRQQLEDPAVSSQSVNQDPFLDLSHAHPAGLAQLYAQKPTRLSSLVREPRALQHALRKAKNVIDACESAERVHGVATVYLSIGTSSWYESPRSAKSDADTNAATAPYDQVEEESKTDKLLTSPVLLVPITLERDQSEIALTLESSIEVPPELLKAFAATDAPLDVAELLRISRTEHGFIPLTAVKQVATSGKKVLDRFSVQMDLIVGLFIHPARDLLEELSHPEKLSSSNIVQALAGEKSAQAELKSIFPEAVPTDRDPNYERGVGDLDSAQQDILDAVATGASMAIDSPSGSDSTGTVAAILADAAASGRNAVYVPGEQSRGNLLLSRLQELGLSEVILDTTGRTWRAKLRKSLARAFAPIETEIDAEKLINDRAELVKVRQDLTDYTEQLHRVRQPWNISTYDTLQALTDLTSLRPCPQTKVRFPVQTLGMIAKDRGDSARSALLEASRLEIFSGKHSDGPWAGATISSQEEVAPVLERIKRIAREDLPEIRVSIVAVAGETGLSPANTLEEWLEQLQMLDGVREVLDVFSPLIFERSAADMVIATASRNWRREHGVVMKRSVRRRRIRQAHDLLRPGRSVTDLHAELSRVQEQREIWRRYCEAGSWPRLPSNLDKITAATNRIVEDLVSLQAVLGSNHPDLQKLSIAELDDLINRLDKESSAAYLLPARVEILQKLDELGLSELVEDLRKRSVSVDLISEELDLAWWASVLGIMLREGAGLGKFNGDALTTLLQELRRLDLLQVNSLVPQTLRRIAQHTTAALVANRDSLQELTQSLVKKRSLDVVQILKENPWLWWLRSIRIVPPVLIPQLVPSSVDLLILEGTERLQIGEIVPILARAKQVVVVGDSRRTGTSSWEDLQEILPNFTMPPGRAKTNEHVAALLAHHGHKDAVVPVPLPRSESVLRLDPVDGRGMPAPDVAVVESSQTEVDRVVDLVLEHALTTPEKSLAVIAMNPRHAQSVKEAITSAVAGSRAVDDFFNSFNAEPFVVIGPAETSGVRRDNVIISLGFAKTPHGRVLHDFGEISGPHGVTRIVDALNVARGDLTVVSSFLPEELDQQRLNNPGAVMLSDLLTLASQSTAAISASWQTTEEAPDRLLVDLAERLYRLGLTVVANLGVSGGIRIPLAIGHPDLPEELLVAVLTDDNAYVKEKSLRRRDRHGVERLEENGWLVHVVFSTAVFVDPEGEAKKILALALDALDKRFGVLPSEGAASEENQEEVPELLVEEAVTTDLPTDLVGQDRAEIDFTAVKVAVDEPRVNKVPADIAPPPETPEVRQVPESAESPDDKNADSRVDPKLNPIPLDDTPPPAPPAPQVVEQPLVEQPLVEQPVVEQQAELELELEPEVQPRSQRPPIAQGLPLAAYSDDQLDELVEWILSDRVKRTPEEVICELRETLMLTRRGVQIDAVLRNVVNRNLK